MDTLQMNLDLAGAREQNRGRRLNLATAPEQLHEQLQEPVDMEWTVHQGCCVQWELEALEQQRAAVSSQEP